MRKELELPFTLLSDPQLLCAEALDAPTPTRKGYYGALALHSEIKRYPKPSFLQPALFIWKGSELVYEWRQSESLLNLFGARGRPRGSEVLDIVKRTLA